TCFTQIVVVKLAPIVLSLNASFMYLGFSLGAALGGFTLIHATVTKLGWVGAACELAALTLFLKTRAGTRAQGTPAAEKISPCPSSGGAGFMSDKYRPVRAKSPQGQA